MSDKIVKSFLNTPLTLLLILLTILIIFCVMKHKLYNLQSIMFDSEDYNEIDYKINNHQSLIKNHIIKLNDIIENSKLKTKENGGCEATVVFLSYLDLGGDCKRFSRAFRMWCVNPGLGLGLGLGG